MTVLLRDLTPDDSDRLLDWRNLPEVARWMYSDHVITRPEHDRWFAGIAGDPTRRYWIIQLDGEPVGLANLADISPANRKASWAYYLASPTVRGKGVGAFVEVFVLDHVFGDLKLNKLCCEVLLENEAVWKMHESFGFQREALYRDHIWKGGQGHDVVGLGLLAADWEKVREASAERLRARGFVIP